MALGRPWCGRTCDKCDNGPAEANGWCSSCNYAEKIKDDKKVKNWLLEKFLYFLSERGQDRFTIAFWAFVAGMLTMLGMGYIKWDYQNL